MPGTAVTGVIDQLLDSMLDRDTERGQTAATAARLHDFESFLVVARVLAQYIARAAVRPADGDRNSRADLVILIDHSTLSDLGLTSQRLRDAGEVHILGTEWTTNQRARVVVLYSHELNVAVLGRNRKEVNALRFDGAWTGYRPTVESVIEAVAPATLPNPRDDSPESSMRPTELCTMSLAAALENHYAVRQVDITRDREELSSVLSILKSISAKRRAHDLLYVFVEQIAAVTGVDRCSVVRVWGGDETGHVVASHEDASVQDIAIDLDRYPEIQKAMDTRATVVVNDVGSNPLTQPFSTELDEAGISAVIVIPIVLFDIDIGSFFLRAALRGRSFTEREISFCEIVGEAASNALERAHLVESIQKANQRLEHLAITDGLTGLFNARHFRERLQEEYDRATRYNLTLGCILIDIDDFKAINDTFGHLQGDSILREISRRISRCARKSDIVARYGGEEIVALLPQTDLDGAIRYAERVLDAVSSETYEGMPPDRPVTVSVGAAVLGVKEMTSVDSVISAADRALYTAKANGKNRIEVYTPCENEEE